MLTNKNCGYKKFVIMFLHMPISNIINFQNIEFSNSTIKNKTLSSVVISKVLFHFFRIPNHNFFSAQLK